MYEKVLLTLLLAFSPLLTFPKGEETFTPPLGGDGGGLDASITFVVDEGLEPIVDRYRHFYNGEALAKVILKKDRTILNDAYNIVATSFADAKNLRNPEKDAFFQSVLVAYKNHKSLVLSPDMVWLLISQGFARYVNAHSEELRPQLVNHSGKMDLVIETKEDLFSRQADCTKLVSDFASEIGKYTKNGIAETLTADFSTTTPAERVASQITLMESVKSYFQYLVMYASCGIPTITLMGTPADWQLVLDKTRKIAQYGLSEWTESLDPILQQFVRAAEGQPDQRFWKSIVMNRPIDRLRGGGCSREKPTYLNGWLLKLFPDENGQTLDSVFHEKEMPSERVCVGFKYRKLDSENGTITSETPMELLAGFIGAKEDTLTNTLTPQIGWLLRKADSEEDLMADLEKKSKGSIDLKVQEVPEMLANLQHINGLELNFTNTIKLPEWFNKLDINHLNIYGKIAKAEELQDVLTKINKVDYLSIYLNKDSDISYVCIRGNTKRPEAQSEKPEKPHQIKSLSLDYSDKVVLPDWLRDFDFNHLTIEGEMTRADRRSLKKTLKKANIKNFTLWK